MDILNTRKLTLSLVLVAACTVPAISSAVTMPANVNPVTVSYADLNLSVDSGVETLYSRLKAGAKKSCGTVSARQLNLFRSNKECIKKALADAVSRIESEKLKQLHSS